MVEYYVQPGYWVADYAVEGDPVVSTGNLGFQLGGIREVTHKRLMDRIIEARAERIKPASKRARKRAQVIEVQAAEIAKTGNEARFFELLDQWIAEKPQIPEAPGIDVAQLFMAQVAMQLRRIEQEQQIDEEEALLVLLLT